VLPHFKSWLNKPLKKDKAPNDPFEFCTSYSRPCALQTNWFWFVDSALVILCFILWTMIQVPPEPFLAETRVSRVELLRLWYSIFVSFVKILALGPWEAINIILDLRGPLQLFFYQGNLSSCFFFSFWTLFISHTHIFYTRLSEIWSHVSSLKDLRLYQPRYAVVTLLVCW
jgi:hypothetical protein